MAGADGLRRRWLLPLAVGLAAAISAVVAVVILLRQVVVEDERAGQAAAIAASLEALASDDLEGARRRLFTARLAASRLTPPGPAEARFANLLREVELVGDLLTICLEDLVEEARPHQPGEWQSLFAEKYANRSVIFQASFRLSEREPGVILTDYPLLLDEDQASIAWSGLEGLAERLVPHEPRKLMLGARLASCRLELRPGDPAGVWVVRFQPDSLVVIEEPAVLRFLRASDAPWQEGFIGGGMKQELMLLPGMPANEVIQLRGPPDRVSRQIVKDRVREWWRWEAAQVEVRLGARSKSTLRLERLSPPAVDPMDRELEKM